MSVLDQILQEIEEKKEKALNVVKIEVDPMEITIHREQYKCLRMAEEIIRKHLNDGWIPVYQEMDDKDLPSNGEHVLISLNDYDFPITARYEKDEDGRRFRLEECYFSQCAFGNPINAWQPLPARYNPKEEEK